MFEEFSRRSLVSAIGGLAAAGLSGCVTEASTTENRDGETRTVVSAPTGESEPTPTPEPTEVTDVDIPETVSVGNSLSITVDVESPTEVKKLVIWGISVIDVRSGKRWRRSFSIEVPTGETAVEKTLQIDWGTDHETTLLVEPDSASISVLSGEGKETDLERVEVVS